MFGEMPIEERYDVFLTMSRLLKLMGFHQRAEVYLLIFYTILLLIVHFCFAATII